MKCFTAEQRKLYERGYPHLVTLGENAKKVDIVKIYNKPWGLYHVVWPRNVAIAFARVGLGGEEPGFGLPDARAAIERRLASPRRPVAYADRHFLFCVEALVGTDPTLEILVSALETLPEDRWSTPGSPFDPATKEKHEQMDPAIHAMNTVIENGNTGYLSYLSGYLLLRASPDVAAKARARRVDPRRATPLSLSGSRGSLLREESHALARRSAAALSRGSRHVRSSCDRAAHARMEHRQEKRSGCRQMARRSR